MEIRREANGNYDIMQPGTRRAIRRLQSYPTGGKRSIVERERDLERIAELYLKGYTQQEIADQLAEERDYTLTRVTIHHDIKAIHKRWIENSINLMEQRIIIECQKLDRIEHEMWELFDRSKLDKVIKEQTVISGENVGEGKTTADLDGETDNEAGGKRGKSGANGKDAKDRLVASGPGSQQRSKSFRRAKTFERTETNIGDIEILKEIRNTVMERSKLLGIGQTRTVNINWRKEAEAEGIDPEKFVFDATERILNAAVERGSIFGSLEAGEENPGQSEEQPGMALLPG